MAGERQLLTHLHGVSKLDTRQFAAATDLDCAARLVPWNCRGVEDQAQPSEKLDNGVVCEFGEPNQKRDHGLASCSLTKVGLGLGGQLLHVGGSKHRSRRARQRSRPKKPS